MPLIPGPRLTPDQRRQVAAVFAPQISQEDWDAWIDDRAFHFSRHEKRLLQYRPVYVIEETPRPL
jgi:hypothetical protein